MMAQTFAVWLAMGVGIAMAMEVPRRLNASVPADEELSIGFLAGITASPVFLPIITAVDIDFRSQFDPALKARGFVPSMEVSNPHPVLQKGIRIITGDSSRGALQAIPEALKFMRGNASAKIPSVNAILGPQSSSNNVAVGPVTSSNHYVSMGIGAMAKELSDKARFPYLFRLWSPPTQTTAAMWQYLKFYEAKRVTIFVTADASGLTHKEYLLGQAVKTRNSAALMTITCPIKEDNTGIAEELRPFARMIKEPKFGKEPHSRLVLNALATAMVIPVHQAFIAEGIVSPHYQHLGHLTAPGMASLVEHFPGYHYLSPAVSSTNFVSSTFLGNFMKLQPYDVSGQEERFAVHSWHTEGGEGYNGAIFSNNDLWKAPPPGVMILLTALIWCGFRSFVDSANRLLHAGVAPKDIRGKLLRDDIMQHTDFAGVFYQVQYNNDLEFASTNTSIISLDPRPIYKDCKGYPKMAFAFYNAAADKFMQLDTCNGTAWADGTNGLQSSAPDKYFSCPPGSRLDDTGNFCVSCDPGSVNPDYNAASCEKCTAGRSSYDMVAGAAANTCIDCPAGYMMNAAGATECDACDRGQYSPTTKQRACINCQKGTYSDNFGSSACKSCPGDMVTEESRALSVEDCSCNKDTYLADPASSKCKKCPESFDCPGFVRIVNGSKIHNMPILPAGFYVLKSSPYEAYTCKEAKELCLGGSPDACGGGRHGLQCASCDNGQTSADEEDCKDCAGGAYISYPAFMIGGIGMMGALHVINTKKGASVAQLPIISVAAQLVSQMQMIGLLSSFDISFPLAVKGMFSFLALFLFDMRLVSTTCYFGYSLSAQYLPGAMLPFAICASMLLVFLVSKTTKNIFGQSMDGNAVFNTLGMILSGLSVAVVKAIIIILECRPNPGTEYTLMNYDGFVCYGDEVMQLMPVLIITGLVFIGFGGAIYGFVVLKGPSLYHASSTFRGRFKFVINRWHPTYYYFGAILLTRNIAMCLVPVVCSDGLLQMVMVTLIFAPVFLGTVIYFPWRQTLANWNDLIVSSMFLFILFLCSYLVEPPESGARTMISTAMVASFCLAMFVILMIISDMMLVVIRGKGLIVTKPGIQAGWVENFVETMSKWSHLTQGGEAEAVADAERFLEQLPEADMTRLMWLLDVVNTGMFAEEPSKRISGISPVRPRGEDTRIGEVKRRSSERVEKISSMKSKEGELSPTSQIEV